MLTYLLSEYPVSSHHAWRVLFSLTSCCPVFLSFCTTQNQPHTRYFPPSLIWACGKQASNVPLSCIAQSRYCCWELFFLFTGTLYTPPFRYSSREIFHMPFSITPTCGICQRSLWILSRFRTMAQVHSEATGVVWAKLTTALKKNYLLSLMSPVYAAASAVAAGPYPLKPYIDAPSRVAKLPAFGWGACVLFIFSRRFPPSVGLCLPPSGIVKPRSPGKGRLGQREIRPECGRNKGHFDYSHVVLLSLRDLHFSLTLVFLGTYTQNARPPFSHTLPPSLSFLSCLSTGMFSPGRKSPF